MMVGPFQTTTHRVNGPETADTVNVTKVYIMMIVVVFSVRASEIETHAYEYVVSIIQSFVLWLF